jgi:hypothetical protein
MQRWNLLWRGCAAGAGRMGGGVLPLCLGLQIKQRNNIDKGNDELAFGGCRFIFRHNNQMIVKVSNEGNDGEDARP